MQSKWERWLTNLIQEFSQNNQTGDWNWENLKKNIKKALFSTGSRYNDRFTLEMRW